MKEITQCLGLVILNGLGNLPCVEYKFKSQDSDVINGSDLVHALFGANSTKIIKLFKFLFVVQDPMVNVPSRKRASNHKVDRFFSHLIQVSTEAFELGRNLSSDKKMQYSNEIMRINSG